MPSRQTIVAVSVSLALHAGLLLAGLLARQTIRTTGRAVEVDCRVAGGPGLFLDLRPGRQGKKAGQPAEDEAPDLVPVHIERSPLTASLPGSDSAPVIQRPAEGTARRQPAGGHPGGGVAGGPAFYGAPVQGKRIVFVLDRSLSMGLDGAFRQARAELLGCLRALPEGTAVQVVLYNRAAEPLLSWKLLPIDEGMIARIEAKLNDTCVEGETDHEKALAVALGFEPDAIYLVTDADDLTAAQVQHITRINRNRIALHTIDVSRRLRAASMLEALARNNGGRHLHVR
jgi:hypothetical protein